MAVSKLSGTLGAGGEGSKVVNRFTQSYVVGAVSGTAMVAAAIVAFVVLISFQAVRDWPGSGIGIGVGHDDSGVAVSPARKVPPGVATPVPAAHPAVSAAAVARTAAPPAAAPGHRQARSHDHGTAVDAPLGRGGISRGSQISGTPARGGAPAATPVAQPAPTAPASPAQPANGNGHGAAHTNATGTSSPGNGGPSGSGGNGGGQGNGNGHGAGPHGAAAENAAPTTTAPQAYATPTPAPEAPPAEAGNGHGNAYGHENDTTPPGNSEHAGGSGH
jgi:hypothetical protein